MAERKPGPVKPPIIDMTARPVAAGGGRPTSVAPADAAESLAEALTPSANATASDARQDEGRPERETQSQPAPAPLATDQPHPAARAGQPWETIAIAAIAGALLGAALIYVLASFVPLPSSGPGFADPAQELADTDRRLDSLEASGAAIADQATRTQVSLDATVAQLDQGLAEMRKGVAAAASQAPAPTDLSAIEAQLRAVSSRLDAVAAGASSADSAALAQSLTDLQTALTGVTARLDNVEQSRTAGEAALKALEGTVAEVQGKLTAEAEAGQQATATVSRAALTDALGSAIAAGRPFASELDAVASASPEPVVPADLKARAATGLPEAEALAQRFAERVPDMMAARPLPAGAAWQDQAFDWVKGMLAIRPAGEAEGEAPDAVMSRLEAAMARHDFTEAAALLAQLPPEMRAATGDVAADVAAIAAADQFIAQLRANPAGAAQ